MDCKTNPHLAPYVPPRRKPVPPTPAPGRTTTSSFATTTDTSPQPRQSQHQVAPTEVLSEPPGRLPNFNYQQGSLPLPGVLPSQKHYPPSSSGSQDAGSPPPPPAYGPGNGEKYQYHHNYQNQNQDRYRYQPHSPPAPYTYAPQGPRDQNRYEAPRQLPRSASLGTTLKSFGSFMKGALNATLDPNNMYGSASAFGEQQNRFGPNQTGFGQRQVPQSSDKYGYGNGNGNGNGTGPQQSQANGATIVNGQALDAAATSRLQMCGIVPMPGRYWYDTRCGAWGLESGPCIGLLPPNLSLGGSLAPNASGPSTTSVFINGRQIHAMDVLQFQAMGITCIPGRWWVNSDGTYGMEGCMIPWGNLRMSAMAAKRTHSGYGSWSNGDSFGGSDGQGFNYVGGHDSTGRMWSVSTDGSGYFSS